MRGVHQVSEWYRTSYRDLRAVEPPTTVDDEPKVLNAIKSIYERHNNTLVTMASAVA